MRYVAAGAVSMRRAALFLSIITFVRDLILVSTGGSHGSPLVQPPEVRAHNRQLSITLSSVRS